MLFRRTFSRFVTARHLGQSCPRRLHSNSTENRLRSTTENSPNCSIQADFEPPITQADALSTTQSVKVEQLTKDFVDDFILKKNGAILNENNFIQKPDSFPIEEGLEAILASNASQTADTEMEKFSPEFTYGRSRLGIQPAHYHPYLYILCVFRTC